MNISDDTFNKFITLLYIVFCMIMYAWSFGTGKPLDLTNISILIAPILPHALHLVTQNRIAAKSIDANVTTEVAKITANGAIH